MCQGLLRFANLRHRGDLGQDDPLQAAPDRSLQVGIQQFEVTADEHFGAALTGTVDACANVVSRRGFATVVDQVLEIEHDDVRVERVRSRNQFGAVARNEQPRTPHPLADHASTPFSTTSASAALTPSPAGKTMSGLISSSATCPSSCTARWETLTSVLARASISAAGRPRKPRSRRAPLTSAIISRASADVIGQHRSATSWYTSTSTPPLPNRSMGPNCGS